jgi:hypothetical protein
VLPKRVHSLAPHRVAIGLGHEHHAVSRGKVCNLTRVRNTDVRQRRRAMPSATTGALRCERAESEARATCFREISARSWCCYLLNKRRLVLRRGCELLFGSGGNDNGASCLPAYVLPNASGGRCRGWRQRSSEVDVVVALQSMSGADCHNAVGNIVAIIINTVMSSSGIAHLHVHAYQRQRPRHKVLHRAVLQQLLQRTVIRRVAACERMRQGHPPLGAAPSTACTMRRLQRSWVRPVARLQAQTATCYVGGWGGWWAMGSMTVLEAAAAELSRRTSRRRMSRASAL